jgi:hypothetical protein
MTDPFDSRVRVPRVWRAVLLSMVMALLGCAVLYPVYRLWQLEVRDPTFRNWLLGWAIACGLTATMLFVIGMWLVDRPMRNWKPPFYMRVLLKGMKRVFLVAELGALGVAMAGGYWMAFGFKIPGK